MSKIEIGDIFEINTGRGKAYFQCVNIDKVRGDLIKVFNKLYNERPAIISTVIDVQDHYFIGFVLVAAFRSKLVEKVGNIPLAGDFVLPKYWRSKHVIKGEFLGWHIVDANTLKRQFVEQLSSEQKQLSPLGIYNHALLKKMIEEGWNMVNW